MRVKRYLYNGIPFVSIVDESDCPVDPYVACYVNSILSSKSPNTTIRYANELMFVLRHFSGKGINLPARISSCEYISYKEYIQFYEHCFFQKTKIDSETVLVFPKINDKLLRNIIVANQRGISKVRSETIQGRVRRLRLFLTWLFDEFHGNNNLNEAMLDQFQKLISKIKIDEQGFGRNRPQTVSNLEDSVIPDDVFSKMIEMVLPSSPNNPYTSSKVRNYLIIFIIMQSGIRRGALAKIKISDCHFHGTYDRIKIYRSINDTSDLRLEKPNQKTKSHYATIDRSLMEQLKFYIDHIRVEFPQSYTHDYLFVSEKNSRGTIGLPISLKAINSIFERLSTALKFHVHPHLLRHKWNEIFDVEGERLQVSPALLEDIRKYAMGWSQNSSMPQLYNEKRLASKARELSKSHQQRVNEQK